jgi:hypothetical protein
VLRVWDSGYMVQSYWLRVKGLCFKIQGSGLRVKGLRSRV